MEADLQQVLKKYARHPDFIGIDLVDANQPGAVDDCPLHMAARKGALDDIKALVAHGAEVNRPGDMGYTPLHYAASWGLVEASELLLTLGADAGLKNEDQKTPNDLAKIAGHAKVMAVLKNAPRIKRP